uniref:Reverse transcriptase domain-containing protein n=1 Tax=Tanacetum cinerariifolium TaxID=118510 RepID=A0A6L2N575_TANCI|nr:hypothetical protein [Tanacetum cinerariifolium]
MADQRTMAELLRAPTEGYAEEIVVPPILAEHFEFKHSLINMMTLDQFFGLEKDNPHDHITDQDSLNSVAGGNLLERRTQDVLTIIENKSKIAKLTHAVNQQTSAVTTAMTAILKQFQATPPPASVKAIEEICVTYSGAHPYYQCLATDSNTFLEFWDNIQGYVSAAAVNYNQGYNRGNNFNQDTSYQAPIQQNQVVPLSELEKIKKINEVNIISMQTQINNVKNELRNEMQTSIQASMSNQTNKLKNLMASFFQMNIASSLGSRSLPGNTIANPKGELKAITTRSGLVLDRPFVPMPLPFINPEEDERVEETLTNPELAEDPRYPHNPYPSGMNQEKQQEKDEIQIHKFLQMFKQLHINITLVDALILILKYQKMLKDLLSNKEKLLELANTPLNENCPAVIHKKLPEKLGDSWKILIPCGFSELKYKALANLGASINLMPLSVWKKLGLPELISTRMTLELANRAICTPAGIARDVFVPVRKFTFPADFVIIDYESDPTVPLILGRPFLQTARALTDVHGEEMILRDEVINPLSGNTTSSSPDHSLEEFANELALITFLLGNDDLLFDIESNLREIEYLLNHDPTKEIDSILEDSVDEDNIMDPKNDLVDTIPEMFTDEHTLDYSSPPLYDDVDDDLVELESDNDDVYDDPFDSKEDKIKESKLLIDELDPPRSSDFLPSPSMTRFSMRIFLRLMLCLQPITRTKYLIRDFNSHLYKLPFHKEVPGSKTLLLFSSKNEKKVFNPGILTSKGVYTSLLLELSYRGPKAFKVIKNFESPMEMFPCSYEEDIHILDVSCLYFYPPLTTQFRGWVKFSILKQALHGWKPMFILIYL